MKDTQEKRERPLSQGDICSAGLRVFSTSLSTARSYVSYVFRRMKKKQGTENIKLRVQF